MTHSELLDRMSSAEFTEWIAFYSVRQKQQEAEERKRSRGRRR